VHVVESGHSFRMFTDDQILKIDGDCTGSCVNDPSLVGNNNIQTLEKREQLAAVEAEKRVMAMNSNVSSDIQLLFERLLGMYPCRWSNNTIVILESFRIDPPYTNVSHLSNTGSGDEAGLSNLIRVLNGIRRKLNIQ
jgi:hypothetical protein